MGRDFGTPGFEVAVGVADLVEGERAVDHRHRLPLTRVAIAQSVEHLELWGPWGRVPRWVLSSMVVSAGQLGTCGARVPGRVHTTGGRVHTQNTPDDTARGAS